MSKQIKPGDRVVIIYDRNDSHPLMGQKGDVGTVLSTTHSPTRELSELLCEVVVDNKPRKDTSAFKGWEYYESQLKSLEAPLMGNPVDHPAHYGGEDNPYEAIKVIEAWQLDFCLGNAVKYISRAGKKTPDAKQDLEKAIWYLQRRLKQLTETTTPPKHLK